MSELNDYREQLTAAVVAAKTGFTEFPPLVEFDNRDTVPRQGLDHPFLTCEIQITAGRQADLSSSPIHRLIGFLILTAKARDGEGTARAYRLLEHFYPQLHRQKIGDVHLEYADFDKPRLVQGWWGISALIPLKIDKRY